ncbi:MAG: TlpA family protein disulfide reductase [Planctomycetes bacterium]|nr:TlpA family protein disulfide reductase [Planctomycetota bacterium]
MSEAQTPRRRGALRSAVALLPLVLVAGYFGVRAWIRGHVDDLIQHAVGQPLPDFRLTDTDGKVWTRADLLGKRAVLHFFRSRCGSCDVEAPAMRDLEQRLRDDTVMLHVMTDQVLGFSPEETAKTLAHKQFTRPVLMADAAFVDAFHHVRWSQVTPVTYVADPTGTITYGLRGMQTVASVTAACAC